MKVISIMNLTSAFAQPDWQVKSGILQSSITMYI